MSVPVLGFWDLRGLASPIRHLLTYAGQDFVDKRYTIGPPPDFECDEWIAKDKLNVPLDFENLPYYIDGDVKISQVS